MWDLIRRNFDQSQRLVFCLNALVVLYIIGVGLATRFVSVLPAPNYTQALATGVYIFPAIMIIFTACLFTGKKNQRQYQFDAAKGITFDQVFWSKVITLLLDYISLAIVGFASTLIMEFLIFHDRYLNAGSIHLMEISVGANFMLTFILVSITILFATLIKSVKGTIAAGLGFQYLGSTLAAPFMILLYSHQWLRWNPFNCLFVQYQINKPINHTMTKLSMPASLFSVIFYALLYLLFAYLIFSRVYPRIKKQH